MEKLGIGLIGLGAHSLRSHAASLALMDDVRIVGGFDPDGDAQTRFLNEYTQAQTYDSLPALLEGSDMDALVIATPDRFHIASLEAAVAAGKHVLVEKPVCDQRADLERVRTCLTEAQRQGLVVSSCHPRRFDPPYLWYPRHHQQLLERLGPVIELRLDFFYHHPSKIGLHAGLLMDHFNHEVDLMHFMFGHAPFRAYKLYDSETRYAAAGQREDGIGFHFFGARTLRRRVYSELMRVRHEGGEVQIDTERATATILDYESGESVDSYSGHTDYDQRFHLLNRNFVDAVAGRAESYLRPEELLVNTESGIALTEDGVFDYVPSNRKRRNAGLPSESEGALAQVTLALPVINWSALM